MNYSKITYPDTNNGLGCRVSIWFTGCTLHCKNCFNSEIWDFNSGIKFSEKTKSILYEILDYPYIKGLSVLGGEPTDHKDELVEFLKNVKTNFPNKDIWLWTGRTLQELIDSGNSKFLEYIDVLVDGPFVEELKDLSLNFRGSSNQIIWKKKNNIWVNE